MTRCASYLLLLALAALPTAARASWFETCDLEAAVIAVDRLPKVRQYDLGLRVISSVPAHGGEGNYIDCREHDGEVMQVQFRIPSWKGVPVAGDRLVLNRTVVGAIQDGVEGDHVSLRFRALHKAPQSTAGAAIPTDPTR